MGESNIGKHKIAVMEKGEQQLVQMDTIMYCIASTSYTYIHAPGKVYMSSRNLKDFEDILPPELFCRIHYSHIVNIQFIDKLVKGRGGAVLMEDGKELEIAIRRKEEFMKRFHP